MLKQIICNIILIANCIGYNVFMYYRLKNFNRFIDKRKKPITENTYGNEVAILFLISLLAFVISSVACVLDGLTHDKLIIIIYVLVLTLGMIEGFILLPIYLKRLARKNDIPDVFKFRGTRPAYLIGPIHAAIVGQFIYTIILIFM